MAKWIFNPLTFDELDYTLSDITELTIDGTVHPAGAVLFSDGNAVASDSTNFFWEDTVKSLQVGDHSIEGTSISVNGVSTRTGIRVNEFGGTANSLFVAHRHSSSSNDPARFLGVRANTDNNTHSGGTVPLNTELATFVGGGWSGTYYSLFGSITIASDTSGTIAAGSAPGIIYLNTSANSSQSPTARMHIDSAGDFNFYSGDATLAGTWTWTSGGWKLNDSVNGVFGTDDDITQAFDNANDTLDTLLGTSLYNIQTTGNSDMMWIYGTNDNIGFGTLPVATTFMSVFSQDFAGGINVTSQIDNITFPPATWIAATYTMNITDDVSLFSFIGQKALISYQGSATTGNVTRMVALQSQVGLSTANDTTFTNVVGASLELLEQSGNTADHTITQYRGVEVLVNLAGAGSITATNMYGVYVENFSDASLTITSSYGIYLEGQTGATNNFGIVLAGNGSGGGIVFGAGQNASIYYDGTNLVITPDLVGTGGVNLVDNDKLLLGTTTTDMTIYSDGTDGIVTVASGLRLGSATTNYVDIQPDGEINLVGTARVIKHIQLPIQSAQGASAPSSRVTEAPYLSWTFAVATTDEADFTVIAPHDMDYTVASNIYVIWYTTDATASGVDSVRWSLQWASRAYGETVNAGSTTDNSGDVLCSAQYVIVQTLVETIPANSVADDDIIGFKLERVALGAGTNPSANTVHVLGLEIEYTSNKLGEAT